MTARKPPRIETLVIKANRLRKPILAEIKRQSGSKKVVPAEPPKPTPEEEAKEALPYLLMKIDEALKVKKWSIHPIMGGSDRFIKELNRLLPPPFRAFDASTTGWDATEFYGVTWIPEGPSSLHIQSIADQLAAKKASRAKPKR